MVKQDTFNKKDHLIFVLGLLFILNSFVIKAQVNNTEINSQPVQGVRIAWDYNSMQRLVPQKGRELSYAGYPRIKRFQDKRIVSVYEALGNGELIQSLDNGKTWSDPVTIFKTFYVTNDKGDAARVHISNVEIIELKNGIWIAACNYRPQKDNIVPFSIVITKSVDKGNTWTQPEVILNAGIFFKDGCWEPALLQLPNEELHIYFANEASYTTSDEQEISVMKSTDNGCSWTAPQTVSFRKGKRDGMPVPLLIEDEILVAIEDNKVDPFKPYIVRTPLSKPWYHVVSGNSPDREYALAEKLPNHIYGGAPYLARLPSGEVLLSYQTTRGRSDDWERSTMDVAIGDTKGRYFGKVTQPFPVPINREAKWNSIALWDERTVVAASATNFDGSSIGAWMILGKIIPELTSGNRNIKVNGIVDTTEWDSYMPIFIGHKGPVQLAAGIQNNKHYLFFGAKVNFNDNGVYRSGEDGINIYIDACNQNLRRPDKGIYKIWCGKNGVTKLYEGREGEWVEITRRKIKMKIKEESLGYDMEIAVPFAVLQKNDRQPIRVNIEVLNFSGEQDAYNECIANADIGLPNTWCEVKFNN